MANITIGKEKKLLCDYKDELIKKYGYDEDFAQNLAVMAESFGDVFDPMFRDIIYEAILSCQFRQAKKGAKAPVENVETILKDYGLSCSLDTDLRESVATFAAKPNIMDEGKYIISDVTRVIALSSTFNWDNPEFLGNVAREIDRLVSNYLGGYNIIGNKLITKNGLQTIEETIVKDHNGISLLSPKSIGEGLERGVSIYNGQRVIRDSFDTSYSSQGYTYETLGAGYLMDKMNLKEIIDKARFVKDTAELETILSSCGLSVAELLKEFDVLDSLERQRMAAYSDNEKLKNLGSDLEQQFKNGLGSKINSIDSALVSVQSELKI